MRRTVRRLLLARHHSATKLDHHRIYDRPDGGRTHVATDQAGRESATALPSLSSIAVSSSDQVHTGDGDSDAVDRIGRFHPRKALGKRRLEKLINHLDQWLHSGFQGTRMNAIRELEAEVSRTLHLCAKQGLNYYRHRRLSGRICIIAELSLSEVAYLLGAGWKWF
jgi:hypothetical protein